MQLHNELHMDHNGTRVLEESRQIDTTKLEWEKMGGILGGINIQLFSFPCRVSMHCQMGLWSSETRDSHHICVHAKSEHLGCSDA